MVVQLSDPVAYHGEGPVWWDGWGGLRFVDMFAGDVLSLAADGSVTRRHVGSLAAAVRPRRDAGAVIAVEHGFALEDASGTLTPLGDIWSDTNLRMNKGACDPDGRFYCGSMAYDHAAGAGSMYRLGPDLDVARVFGDATISNGLAWSPDGTAAYYADTATGRVDVFDYDAASGLHQRRPLVAIPEEQGSPDGLCVDAAGGVWVALYGGAAVHRYTAAGSLSEVIELPVSRPTACTFGGPGLADLFITTSRENLPPGAEPRAGALFLASPGVTGLPTLTFAG